MAETRQVTSEQQRKAQAAAWASQQAGSQQWNWWCQLFAEQAYGTKGRFPSALAAGNALGDKAGLNRALDKAEPGDLVFFSADDTNNGYGHVGIYLGGDRMVSATPAGVKETSITKDGYYGPRFRGTAAPPTDWKGQASTPELQAGATKILAAVGSGATGDKAVSQAANQPASSPVLQQQQAKAETARREIANWTSVASLAQENASTLQARLGEITQEMALPDSDVQTLLAEQRQIETQLKDMQTRQSQATTRLTQERNNLAAAETAVAKEEQRLGTAVAEAARPPTVTTIGGQPFTWDAASSSFVPAPGLPAAPGAAPPTTTVNGTVYERQADGSYSPARGLPTAQELPGTAEMRQVQLETAQVALTAAQEKLRQATSPEAQRLAQIQVGQAQTSLDKAQFDLTQAQGAATRPTPVNVPSSQENITQFNPVTNTYESVPNPAFRAPAPELAQTGTGPTITQRDPRTGALTTIPNPAYRAPALQDPVAEYQRIVSDAQSRATRERDRLLSLQQTGTISPEEAQRRFQEFWDQYVDPEVQGARAVAERTRAGEQRKLEEQQRAEDVRVTDINRQRQLGAFQAGQEAVNQLRPILPSVRSEAFLRQSAENVNRIGRGEAYQVSPEAFDPRGYAAFIPDLTQLAERQAARFLANVSPAAAAAINRPLPPLPAAPDIQSILNGLNVPLPGMPPGLPE